MFKIVFKFIVIVIAFIALIAPFTFLKPVITDQAQQDKDKRAKPIVVEKPLHSVKLPKFSKIRDTKLKKKTFFDFLKPTIIKANNQLLITRKQVLAIQQKLTLAQTLTKDEQAFLRKNVQKYRITGELNNQQQVQKLLRRIDIVPTELVLVQAANESAWGTSRFARIGLNFFGLWCYKKGCGMVPNARDEDGKHEVAAFQSIDTAVEKYLYNINSHYAYEVFRTIRAQLRTYEQPLKPEILATGLLPYSERGADYVSDIIDMLRHNARYIKVDA